jgi:hypothetical protein
MALHEKLIKERFFRFAFQNPRFMLEVYLWHKPKWLIREISRVFGDYHWKLPNLLCLLTFMVLATAAWRRLDLSPEIRKTIETALLVTAVMSLAPPFWTYPLHHVLGETFLVWLAVILSLATLLLSRAWAMVRPVVQSRA